MEHHPVYPVGRDHTNQPERVQQIQPLLDKDKVALYFNRHSHTLQCLRPAGSTTDYVILSGGGTPLAPPPV